MYVLVDLEWYEGKKCGFMTQISGLRTDGSINILDHCDLLAAPPASAALEKIILGNGKNCHLST